MDKSPTSHGHISKISNQENTGYHHQQLIYVSFIMPRLSIPRQSQILHKKQCHEIRVERIKYDGSLPSLQYFPLKRV